MQVLGGLNRHNWGREALSGITLAAIAVPLNIGYAQIAGLPPTAGLRFAAPIFFANANVFQEAAHHAVELGRSHGIKHIVLDCEAITDIDVTAARVVSDTIAWVRAQDVSFDFSRVRADLKAELEHLDVTKDARIFDSNRMAVTALGGATS